MGGYKNGINHSSNHVRGASNKLSVIHLRCLSCGHERALEGNINGQNILKCARCKVYHDRGYNVRD